MADGSDREVTQADQNNINSQWSLFFTDLDELLSEYEQHRSTNDIAITENLTIRLENAVRALQSVSHFVSYTNKEAVQMSNFGFQPARYPLYLVNLVTKRQLVNILFDLEIHTYDGRWQSQNINWKSKAISRTASLLVYDTK